MTHSDESDLGGNGGGELSHADPLVARFMEATDHELAGLIGLIEAELCKRGWSPRRVWSKQTPAERP